MIEKLDPNKPMRVEPKEKFDFSVDWYFPPQLIEKINELIEAVNKITELTANVFIEVFNAEARKAKNLDDPSNDPPF
ncbi:MAG TPA: hypothetical protein VJ044_16030 [Candidatus Hodarchaeales archaeon]|nr:hypothetical protein [Candidatus Hodarchaeales archaeon]